MFPCFLSVLFLFSSCLLSHTTCYFHPWSSLPSPPQLTLPSPRAYATVAPHPSQTDLFFLYGGVASVSEQLAATNDLWVAEVEVVSDNEVLSWTLLSNVSMPGESGSGGVIGTHIMFLNESVGMIVSGEVWNHSGVEFGLYDGLSLFYVGSGQISSWVNDSLPLIPRTQGVYETFYDVSDPTYPFISALFGGLTVSNSSKSVLSDLWLLTTNSSNDNSPLWRPVPKTESSHWPLARYGASWWLLGLNTLIVYGGLYENGTSVGIADVSDLVWKCQLFRTNLSVVWTEVMVSGSWPFGNYDDDSMYGLHQSHTVLNYDPFATFVVRLFTDLLENRRTEMWRLELSESETMLSLTEISDPRTHLFKDLIHSSPTLFSSSTTLFLFSGSHYNNYTLSNDLFTFTPGSCFGVSSFEKNEVCNDGNGNCVLLDQCNCYSDTINGTACGPQCTEFINITAEFIGGDDVRIFYYSKDENLPLPSSSSSSSSFDCNDQFAAPKPSSFGDLSECYFERFGENIRIRLAEGSVMCPDEDLYFYPFSLVLESNSERMERKRRNSNSLSVKIHIKDSFPSFSVSQIPNVTFIKNNNDNDQVSLPICESPSSELLAMDPGSNTLFRRLNWRWEVRERKGRMKEVYGASHRLFQIPDNVLDKGELYEMKVMVWRECFESVAFSFDSITCVSGSGKESDNSDSLSSSTWFSDNYWVVPLSVGIVLLLLLCFGFAIVIYCVIRQSRNSRRNRNGPRRRYNHLENDNNRPLRVVNMRRKKKSKKHGLSLDSDSDGDEFLYSDEDIELRDPFEYLDPKQRLFDRFVPYLPSSCFDDSFESFEMCQLIRMEAPGIAVMRAIRSETESFVGLKIFNVSFCDAYNDFFRDLRAHLELLTSLHHPNVVRVTGAFCDFPRIGFVSKYYPRSLADLFESIRKRREARGGTSQRLIMPWRKKVLILFDLAKGLSYLHSNGLIHRFLSPENVLIDSRNTCRLWGLPMTKYLQEQAKDRQMHKFGPYYQAPEVTFDSSNQANNNKQDIFSLSMIMFELLTEERNPFAMFVSLSGSSSCLQVAQDEDFRPATPRGIPHHRKWYVDLMRQCWRAVPYRRPHIDKVVEIIEGELSRMEDAEEEVGSSGRRVGDVEIVVEEEEEEEGEEIEEEIEIVYVDGSSDDEDRVIAVEQEDGTLRYVIEEIGEDGEVELVEVEFVDEEEEEGEEYESD